jgi:cell division protein FtsN
MKGKLIVSVVVASVVVMFTSCKIQDAPGAYQRAKGRITVEVLKQQNENKPEVAPMPTPVVREPEQAKEIAKPQEVVAEPVFVPIPVVEPEPTPEPTPTPVVVEEKEVTRAEKFEVVEGQENVVLKKYHVVIGSFGNKDNALRLQAQMRPQYEPILVQNDKGMYRVLLMTYDTYNEAKTKIAEVRSQFPDAWVLIRE